MKIQLYQINNALLKMEKLGHHFRYIKQFPIQNNKASFFKDNNELVVELKVNEKIYNASDFLILTRKNILDQITTIYFYLQKKIDDNLRIHVTTTFCYSLLPEKVEKNIKIIQTKLALLLQAITFYLLEYDYLNLSIEEYDARERIKTRLPDSLEIREKFYKENYIDIDANHLVRSWYHLINDVKAFPIKFFDRGNNNCSYFDQEVWSLTKDEAIKLLAKYFNSILDCLNRILKEVDEVV